MDNQLTKQEQYTENIKRKLEAYVEELEHTVQKGDEAISEWLDGCLEVTKVTRQSSYSEAISHYEINCGSISDCYIIVNTLTRLAKYGYGGVDIAGETCETLEEYFNETF